jgi:beta-phosphoglucomutase-like phosphatase (HAD superfamily)
LFDQGAASQVGERQVDLEEMIAFEDSLLAKVQAGDKAGADAWVAQAKAGQVMRIC